MTSPTPQLVLLIALAMTFLGFVPPAEGQRRIRSGESSGFDDIVFAISFSPDGGTLAIARGASDPVHRFGRIELWDTHTLTLRHLLKGFDGPVRSISFSPDGHTLISGSTEFRSPKLKQDARSREGLRFGELKWWDTVTGELKQKVTMPGEESYAIQATQSPDGKQLAVAESFLQPFPIFSLPPFGGRNLDLSISRAYYFRKAIYKVEMKLVDAQTGKSRFKLDMDQPGIAHFSPDGMLLAVANGKQVKLWNTQTGKEARNLKDLKGNANAILFSPDGQTLAVASTRFDQIDEKDFIKIIGISEIKLFNVSSGKVIARLTDVGAVNSLAFSPNGRTLIAGGVLPGNKGETAGFRLLDLDSGKSRDVPTGDYKEAVDLLAVTQAGGFMAFRSGPSAVKLLDTHDGTLKQTWDADSVGDAVERPSSRFLMSVKRVLAIAFSVDGTRLSGESDQGEIKSWDHRTGEVKRSLSMEQSDPTLVVASSGGKSFAEVSQGKLLFWDENSDTKRIVPLPALNTISALALSADGRTLAVGSAGKVTLLAPSGEVAKELSLDGVVTRLVFSDAGRMIAGADEEGSVRIWNVANGRIERTLSSLNEITALIFAPNGELLATAATDRTIAVWNLKRGLPQAKFQKHDATINALAFSPDTQLLASGGDDRTIVIWDVGTGKSKHTFKGHEQTVASLAFSRDGRLLASGSGNASVVLWEVGTGKLGRVLK